MTVLPFIQCWTSPWDGATYLYWGILSSCRIYLEIRLEVCLLVDPGSAMLAIRIDSHMDLWMFLKCAKPIPVLEHFCTSWSPYTLVFSCLHLAGFLFVLGCLFVIVVAVIVLSQYHVFGGQFSRHPLLTTVAPSLTLLPA